MGALAWLQQEPVALTQDSGTTVRLVAVSAPTANIAWVSGAKGTWVKTTDAGLTWKTGQVQGAESMDFRDVQGIDGNNAYLLAAGTGQSSRIYHTTDGGATWRLQFTNMDSAGFYDCMDFWDDHHGIVVGDATHGELAILTTTDGEKWARLSARDFPPPLDKEGSFASSGTCVTTLPGGRAWIATTKGRVLRTTDFGKTWQVSLTPLAGGADTLGATSVSFINPKVGVVFGGYGAVPGGVGVAVSSDGGASWTATARPDFPGAAWGGAFVKSALKQTIVAVGPGGSAYSRDNGATWMPIDKRNYWGLGFSPGNRGWAVGAAGRITRLSGF
ncbi:MAG TPA: YCF48-related protein [Gemmatimonadaceae bacterium]|nr:YCF48-related protein [Gemmatimonadaceae bacterium]